MQKTLFLYTTLGCHLCEDAKALAWPVMQHFGYRLHEIEIADDDQLVERYGIRIPVVQREDSGQELGWPFSQEQLAELLAD
ncbi:glutaredoxin family protein [Aestuariicella sp. G3-2]|uniref:glutaredoxin family protein n=1 Tax=Pseudomaricurvus albidus TaxID=2842452 RepID=UPI001C0D3E51|nr:glutaredoxin family protein [Aestuariicella albida]MBU3071234.1 glutaredoxin family protein [Aestuariicella albida]